MWLNPIRIYVSFLALASKWLSVQGFTLSSGVGVQVVLPSARDTTTVGTNCRYLTVYLTWYCYPRHSNSSPCLPKSCLQHQSSGQVQMVQNSLSFIFFPPPAYPIYISFCPASLPYNFSRYSSELRL